MPMKAYKRKMTGREATTILAISICILLAGHVEAYMNPSSAYCKRLGYGYEFEKTPKGVAGVCILPDGTRCEEWAFAKGLCGEKHNYCTLKGYGMKLIQDSQRCAALFGNVCTVCILEDGTEVESTSAANADTSLGTPMNLNDIRVNLSELAKRTTTTTIKPAADACGDGICGPGESSDTCPGDCPAQASNLPAIIAMAAVVIFLLLMAVLRKKPHKDDLLATGQDELDQLPKE